MKVIEQEDQIIVSNYPEHAITIGNFDGCHIGHQKLIEKIIEGSSSKRRGNLVITFDPSPRAFFSKEPYTGGLFTKEQKIRVLKEMGVDQTLFQKFDHHFIEMSHIDFYERVLKGRLNCKTIVIGDNFRFGYQRKGDLNFLEENTRKDSINLFIVSRALYKGAPINSTRIRDTLTTSGEITEVNDMLGRPYGLEGQIQYGEQLGRRIEIPTINLDPLDQLVPHKGVYAGYVWLEEEKVKKPTIMNLPKTAVRAVFNIGIRPTINSLGQLRIEAHLLDGTYGPNALYGLKTCFYFCSKIRDEKKFGSLSELKIQIEKDIAEAKIRLI